LDSAAVDCDNEVQRFIGRSCKLDAAPRAIEENVSFHRAVTGHDLLARGVPRVSTAIPVQRKERPRLLRRLCQGSEGKQREWLHLRRQDRSRLIFRSLRK